MYLLVLYMHVIEVKSGNSCGKSTIGYVVATSANKMTYAYVCTYMGHIFASGLMSPSLTHIPTSMYVHLEHLYVPG